VDIDKDLCRLIKIKMDTGQESGWTGIKMDKDLYRQGSRWTRDQMASRWSRWTGIKGDRDQKGGINMDKDPAG
jgi:hypothetical protein